MTRTRDVRFTPLTALDVEDAVRWYEEQRPGLGGEFEAALNSTLALLRQAPEAGPPVHREVRRLLMPRFPYAVYYLLLDDAIEVRGCLHQHRDPATWRGRAQEP